MGAPIPGTGQMAITFIRGTSNRTNGLAIVSPFVEVLAEAGPASSFEQVTFIRNIPVGSDLVLRLLPNGLSSLDSVLFDSTGTRAIVSPTEFEDVVAISWEDLITADADHDYDDMWTYVGPAGLDCAIDVGARVLAVPMSEGHDWAVTCLPSAPLVEDQRVLAMPTADGNDYVILT